MHELDGLAEPSCMLVNRAHGSSALIFQIWPQTSAFQDAEVFFMVIGELRYEPTTALAKSLIGVASASASPSAGLITDKLARRS
ncbi:hypothetical protein PHBOTO_002475 [Pseudozyma hubeiensis]|nr:hypothetical protein PHBOTO_002475 [Pseudozyma hubeiensis]